MCIYHPKVLTERIIKNFRPTRLYIKELFGVFYFGKTTKNNPYSYNGSGVIWSKRIKKYGKENIKTLWVSDWYKDPHEIQEIALHFSKENQIVESEKWANLKPENGLDGDMSSDTRKKVNSCPERKRKQSIKMSGENNPSKKPTSRKKASVRMKKQWKNENFRELCIEKTYRQWEDTEFQKINSERLSKLWENPEFVKKMSNTMSERNIELWKDTEFYKIMSDKRKKMWQSSEYREKQTGRNHPNFDHKFYTFVHKSGIFETSNRYDFIKKYCLGSDEISRLISGKRKSCHGWSLFINPK